MSWSWRRSRSAKGRDQYLRDRDKDYHRRRDHREQPGEAGRSGVPAQEALQAVRELEAKIKEQRIHITDTYGPYLGREFLQPEKLSELSKLIQSDRLQISQAIELYKKFK